MLRLYLFCLVCLFSFCLVTFNETYNRNTIVKGDLQHEQFTHRINIFEQTVLCRGYSHFELKEAYVSSQRSRDIYHHLHIYYPVVPHRQEGNIIVLFHTVATHPVNLYFSLIFAAARSVCLITKGMDDEGRHGRARRRGWGRKLGVLRNFIVVKLLWLQQECFHFHVHVTVK